MLFTTSLFALRCVGLRFYWAYGVLFVLCVQSAAASQQVTFLGRRSAVSKRELQDRNVLLGQALEGEKKAHGQVKSAYTALQARHLLTIQTVRNKAAKAK